MATREQSLRGKAGPLAGTWVVAVLLALASPAPCRSQVGPPDLKPYRPDGWTGAVVVSNRQGGNADTPVLRAADRLYVDFAVINSGGSPVTGSFRIDLFVDGRLQESFEAPAPLAPRSYRFLEDYPLGRLGVGTHTLRIVADAGGSVAEADEANNEHARSIVVGGDCYPLTLRASPRGGGILVPSLEPNCGEATVSVSSLSVSNEDPDQELGIAGEPIAKARRAGALAALEARVRQEGRVRVIVGLRSESRSAPLTATGSRRFKARPSRIAHAQQSLLARMSGHGVSSIRRFRFVPFVAMELDQAALEALASDPEVASIEEDGAVQPALAESTSRVGAPQAWSEGFAGSGQAVAILDTGVDGDHPFLAGKVVSEACYSGAREEGASLCPGGVRESTGLGSAAPCPLSDCFHGTAVAGIAAGRGTGFSGVAREARIIAVQAFSRCGEDCLTSNYSDLMAGMERILELSADFDIAAVTMSFGSGLYSETCDFVSPGIKALIDRLREAGIAPIVASGNDRSSTVISFPACLSSTVSVGSTDGTGDATEQEVVSDFSNSSALLDLLAPGSSITTSVPGDGFSEYDGTSLAVPHVAGAWAVLKSKAPHASVAELLSVLKRTGIPIADPRNGLVTPRIQVDAALNAVISPLSYASGTRLTLTARPAPGFRFRLWRGCGSPSGNRCVVEMSAAGNVTAIFEPLGAAPDLITTSLTAPPTAAAGEEVSMAAGIRNRGSRDAGPFRVGFYLSADTTITPEDTWFAACSYEAGLAAGASETCSRPFPIPRWVRPGRYFLGAVVDDLDRVAEKSETNNARAADSGPVEILAARTISRSFVPVVLNAAGRRGSFFTSELTLTNRGVREARLDYTYTAHAGGGSGTASDRLAPGQQKVKPDALRYLRSLGIPVPDSGNRIGTLAVEALASSEVGVTVRTTTAVPEGRAGLAYPGVPADGGFREAVYLCGLRQNRQDRSNVALQNMGTSEEGSIILRTRVYAGHPADTGYRSLGKVSLEPGEFHQYSGVLDVLGGREDNGYVEVERTSGTAPFYAYGVINDQVNSDGSFVFPVTASSLEGTAGQTLPVIVETGVFRSELTVTNFSEEARTLHFSFVADGVRTDDHTATFSLTLEPGEQRIIPDVIDTELRQKGVEGVGSARGGLAGALFATVESADMGGIVIGARTGSPAGPGEVWRGQYGVFYNAVPDGAAFTDSAWGDALQQNEENRSNLALVNTGEMDDSASLFSLDIYDGETGMRVKTITRKVSPKRWIQINSILRNHTQGTTQGYVRIRKVSGNNPFLAYGVVNDGGAPGERSGDGAYLPARE